MTTLCPSAYPASFRPCRNASTTDADSPGDLLLRKPITAGACRCANAAYGAQEQAMRTTASPIRRIVTSAGMAGGSLAEMNYRPCGAVKLGVEHGLLDHVVGPQQYRLRNRQAEQNGKSLGIRLVQIGVTRPRTDGTRLPQCGPTGQPAPGTS